ncbi:hypothetical protein ACOSQ2_020472 [Xanthoceras sorbifolium]
MDGRVSTLFATIQSIWCQIHAMLQPLEGNAHPVESPEAQISAEESRTGEGQRHYLPLFKAARSGDWKSAKNFIEHNPNALTARITTVGLQTVFHVAAESCQWRLILGLLELIVSPESLAVQDADGNTVLHYVAHSGSLKIAKALVKKNYNLLQIVNNEGELPLLCSILSESKELVLYFTLETRVDQYPSLLVNILRTLIVSGYLDIALCFVKKYPELAILRDEVGNSLLMWLAVHGPSFFFSGSNLGFLKGWIYKFVPKQIKKSSADLVMINMKDLCTEESSTPVTSIQPTSSATQVLQCFKRLFWKAIAQLAPSIKMVQDEKLKHECAVELVNLACMKLSSMGFQQIFHFLQDPPILSRAIEGGIEEFVKTLLEHFPEQLVGYDTSSQRNIFQIAVEYRQEKIVNIMKKMSPTKTRTMCEELMESNNTTLHLAGKLAPAFKLYSVSGAALQLQRELQWFKEAEKIILPFEREFTNAKRQTPKEVFKIAHKELVDQGEKWMKDTANSSMLVSTLIATVLFAAAFTVPGGNVNDKGIPIFLQTNAFMVFAISDAIGLFSSLTSLLMFLAILTARYMVDDFLESLPKKLIIGLGSLFFAIAAMIIAFGATLTIVLSERWQWVAMPITLLASFPVAIFVMLQLPLFVQMVQSTYGSSMFRPWPSRL